MGFLRLFFVVALVIISTVTAQTADGPPPPPLQQEQQQQQCETWGTENGQLRARVLELELTLAEATSRTCPTTPPTNDLDDASLLELFATSVKEHVLAAIPPTDEACTFDYVRGKCTPVCACAFQPRWGDYTPGRACRLTSGSGDRASCAADSNDDRPWALRLAQAARHQATRAATHVLAKLRETAPPTDAACTFSFKRFRCEPAAECTWDFQLGDFNPHRACRYRGDDVARESDASEEDEDDADG